MVATVVVYILLSAGAITTLYPFMLMVSTGFKGPTDENDNALVPKYWFDKRELLDKYVHDKYRQDVSAIESTRTGPAAPAAQVDQYRKFLLGLSPLDWKAGFGMAPNQMASRLGTIYQE